MSNGNFYTPEEIRPLYGEIIPAYQVAFAASPWNEVSKCADERSHCIGGLSSLAIGEQCTTCGLYPSRPAYEADELVERFDEIGSSRPTAWYAEQNDDGVTMAAVAWRTTPSVITEEKYADVPVMGHWIKDLFYRSFQGVPFYTNEPEIMWLDEVFANRQIKPNGNLQNFGKFVVGLAEKLDCGLVAYRTIEPRMTTVAGRDFGTDAVVIKRNEGVPDRRDFVIINTATPWYKKGRKQI